MENAFKLCPRFENVKSYYGKAKVFMTITNDFLQEIYLISYTTKVAQITREKYPDMYHLKINANINHSATTLRHIKEFLKSALTDMEFEKFFGCTKDSKKFTKSIIDQFDTHQITLGGEEIEYIF